MPSEAPIVGKTAAPRKLHVISLGCQMSEADASEMSEPIIKAGFSYWPTPEGADAILMTTCTVRQHAEDKALSLIGRLRPWKEENPERLLIVAGCAAERLGPWIRQRFSHVDMVVGAKSIGEFPKLIEAALEERFDGLSESSEAFGPAAGPTDDAFVTIMRGCNYSCSYCIVPAVRGREIYRPAEDILRDAALKITAGAKEITLLGQTVNSYSASYKGKTARFPDLLRLLDALPGMKRLRFMSPHPRYVDEAMIQAMAECPSVCDQLHLPVQSGANRILKLMRRNYTRESYLKKIDLARTMIPKIVLSTDVIVGFPTETEEDFEETLSLIETLKPATIYSFKYSPRKGTESASLPDDVSQSVKEDRLARLNALAAQLKAKALGGDLQ